MTGFNGFDRDDFETLKSNSFKAGKISEIVVEVRKNKKTEKEFISIAKKVAKIRVVNGEEPSVQWTFTRAITIPREYFNDFVKSLTKMAFSELISKEPEQKINIEVVQ